jgi:tRNA-Thr(GGU) m(6)t(6)A37 methyltransferase TsaA
MSLFHSYRLNQAGQKKGAGAGGTRIGLMDTRELEQAIVYRAIGRVENDFDRLAPSRDIRAVDSRIVLDPSVTEGLQGLEPGQQIMVIFCFHRAQDFDLLQHPQGDTSRPRRGVFALRSPRRPNGIGVTVVDLLSVEANVLRVRGLDAINGTPVLDLKPA